MDEQDRVDPALIEWLRRLRRERGSFQEVARAAGIRSSESLRRVETGIGRMSVPTLQKLVARFGAEAGVTAETAYRWNFRPPLPVPEGASEASADAILEAAKARIGRQLEEVRREHRDDEQFALIVRSAEDDLREMRDLARLERRQRGDAGGEGVGS